MKKEMADNSGFRKSGLRENIEAFAVAIILALFIRTFVVQAFKIPSGSMKETLQIGDHILVNKFIYGLKFPFLQKNIIPIKDPGREDVVVFKCPMDPAKDYIKRVIGVGGDKIEIKYKTLYVNGEPFKGDYAIYKDSRIYTRGSRDSVRDHYGPVKVPENNLFVMGDNRDNSQDSRFWGFVGLDAVKGKAFIIYWSWDKYSRGLADRVRWKRLGRLLE